MVGFYAVVFDPIHDGVEHNSFCGADDTSQGRVGSGHARMGWRLGNGAAGLNLAGE